MLSSVSIGFREIGRKLRRRKLRRAVTANLRQQAAQTVAIGDRAWSAGFEPAGSGELRANIAALEQGQSAVASKRASISDEKTALDEVRSKEAAGFDARRTDLDGERQGKSERVAQAKKALAAHKSSLASFRKETEQAPDALKTQELGAAVSAAEAELAACGAELKVVDDKLKELARERKEVVGAFDKKISEAQKAIAGTQREDAALGGKKKEAFSSLGQLIVARRTEETSLSADSPVVEELRQLAEMEAERARLEAGIISLQAETDALPARSMARFYGLVAIGLLILALLIWLSWFFFGGRESEEVRRDTATASSGAVASERRGAAATSRSSRSPTRRSDSDLGELLETLQSGDAEEKADAGRALGEIGENAVAPALEVLESNDQEQRANAAFALAEMVDLASGAQADVTPALVEALEDEYWRVRANAAIALGNLRNGDPAAFDGLDSALSDGDPRVRAAATYAIGELGADPVESVSVLVERLEQDEVPDVRVVAANALALTDAADAVPALQRAVEDEHWEVSYASMSALGLLREKAIVAVPTLIDKIAALPAFRAIVPAQSIKLILEGAGPDFDADRDTLSALSQRLDTLIRAVSLTHPRYDCPAASSLAVIIQWLPSERTRIVEGLAGLISQRQTGSSDFVGDLALPIFTAMAEVRSERDSDFIEKLEDPDRNVRWAAASVLGIMESERAIPALARALADEDALVQGAAARSLAELDPESVEALVEVLGHQNPDARVHAAFALASIGRGASEESVVPALRNALQDNEFKVRYAMSCALKNIQRITACDPESILAPAGWRGR